MTFLFVGERPSFKAARIGATWQNGKLAGKTLRAALIANNIDPDGQQYLNLWQNPEPGEADRVHELQALILIREAQQRGLCIVAMGRLVSRLLEAGGVSHLQMVHPAARGSIRKRERYIAHVAEVTAKGGEGR